MVAGGGFETALERVVAGKIKVDHIELCRTIVFAAWRAGLDQPRRNVAAFGQQEPANLRHMRAGGQVDVVGFTLFVEAVAGGEVVELAVDLLEIPRVLEVHPHQSHLGRG